MKNGIQIEIQIGLSETEDKEARLFSNNFLKEYITNGMKFKNTQGGYYSYYKRGVVGLRFSRELNLYFRRASKNKRIFQIVKEEELKPATTESGNFVSKHYSHDKIETKNINDLCMCPRHVGQLKVSNKYGDTKTYLYAIIGDIKG